MFATPQSKYSLRHLSDDELECDIHAHAGRDRTTTADLLAHIAEYDRRKRYLPAGFSSMHVYCTTRLLFSDDMAYKRIRVARAARRFPEIYDAIVDGRLNVSGIVLLAKQLIGLKRGDGQELIRAAMGKSKVQIELLLAERFPRPDVPTVFRMIQDPKLQQDAGPSREPDCTTAGTAANSSSLQLAPGPIVTSHPEPAFAEAPRPRIEPLSPKRFALQLTMDESTHDKLRRAQDLLGHAVPSGDVAQVIDRALDALITQLQKRKFAKSSRPRPAPPAASSSTRHIPAHVIRAVSERDEDRCAFVSDAGQRCTERRFLEFHHVETFARGGDASVDNIQLRCSAHNQYEAEQEFGTGFMHAKREANRAEIAGRVSKN